MSIERARIVTQLVSLIEADLNPMPRYILRRDPA